MEDLPRHLTKEQQEIKNQLLMAASQVEFWSPAASSSPATLYLGSVCPNLHLFDIFNIFSYM